MKILAPVNNSKEVKDIIDAGADELYCGVMPLDWKRHYTNISSPNRREWKTANISSFDELKKVVDIAHSSGVPLYLALNALYTQRQYPLVLEQAEKAKGMGIDALIVADIGLLLTLKKEGVKLDIHISTGGTTFNSETARFYEDLGVSRIVLPRHLQIQEIEGIVKDNPSIKFEVFILNSGCKNIDGFCTFHHGINEVLHKKAWDLPKGLNLDRHFLNMIRMLPQEFACRIKGDVFGIDSACLLNYKVSAVKGGEEGVLGRIARNFTLLSGVDTCGACRLPELQNIGVYGVKIVGRNYSKSKKVKDTRFLRAILDETANRRFDRKEFYTRTKNIFRDIYKIRCGEVCYYPDGM